jgi:hypothetical protein
MAIAGRHWASWPRAAGVAGTIGVIITLAAVDIAAFLRLT